MVLCWPLAEVTKPFASGAKKVRAAVETIFEVNASALWCLHQGSFE